jgi:hypothetical protein
MTSPGRTGAFTPRRRLTGFGLHAVLVKNRLGRYFVMLVEQGKESLFSDYLQIESLEIICWMDTNEALERLERAVKKEEA